MKNDELLTKWLNNELLDDELGILKSSPEYASYIKIAKASSKLSPPVFNSEANFKSVTSTFSNQKTNPGNSKKGKLRSMKTFLRIAAVIAILFAGFHFINNLDTSIRTSVAEKQSLELPDHSEVILNSKSEINFNKNNWNENRTVSLLGEAYFKVSKGNIFSVETEHGIVSVLGTQFNIFSRGDNFYINCYKGLVSVSFNDTLIQLGPGKEAKIEKGFLIRHDFSNAQDPSWLSNESYFENITLAVVLKEIERQYPIKITSDEINVEMRFTGAFTHNDLDLALKSICEPLDLTYSINGNDDVILYAKGNK